MSRQAATNQSGVKPPHSKVIPAADCGLAADDGIMVYTD